MYFSKKDKLVTEIYLKSLGTKKTIKKSNLRFSEKDKKNNIFPCKNLKNTKFKLQTQFSRHYFHDQNVEKHKKDKNEILSFP